MADTQKQQADNSPQETIEQELPLRKVGQLNVPDNRNPNIITLDELNRIVNDPIPPDEGERPLTGVRRGR